MEFLTQFINDYGMEIIGAIATAIAGFLGMVVKNLVTKFLNDKTKQDIAKIVVQGIEQCYQALSGPEKLQKAIETATEMLNEKGIKVTEVELRMLLENAVGEFNKVFEKEKAAGKSQELNTWADEQPKNAEVSG